MELKLDYGILLDDPQLTGLVKSCDEIKDSVVKLNERLEYLSEIKDKYYDKLTKEAKIELHMFMLYALNGCQWMMLRLNGIDPTQHPIKHELTRVKEMMVRWKQAKELKNRPMLDKEAAKRFVRSGLWDPKTIKTDEPPNKKIHFDEDD